MLSELEKKALVDELGSQVAKQILSVAEEQNTKLKSIVDEAKKNNGISKEDLETVKSAHAEAEAKIERVLKAQGKELATLRDSINLTGSVKADNIADVLRKDEAELAKIFNNKQGVRSYEILKNSKGETFMRLYDSAKTAYTHGTVDDIDNGANVSSISHALDTASILRMGGNAAIVNQYRNTPYIFDLCNTITTNSPLAIWIDEQTKQGSSSDHTEGSTKSKSQYFYKIQSSEYHTEATMLTFTNKFALDFSRLQQEALNAANTDLINAINAAILPRIITAATAYNTAATFAPLIDATSMNDFDVIAAMAAQSNSATFGSANANAALMSTYKKYAMGLTKDSTHNYLNAPDVISNISFVGNAGVGADDVVVGDFKQYNIQLRGGVIMRVGYNGSDFAENKFSVVLEQDYFDYISTIRKAALVKGTTFAAVKAAINAA